MFFRRRIARPALLLDLPESLPPGWNDVRPLPAKAWVKEAAERVLGDIPPDKHVAVVATADLFGARLAAMARMGNDWTFMGYVGREWGGKLEAGAELRWTK